MPVSGDAADIWEGLTTLAMEADGCTPSDDVPRACVVVTLTEGGALELHRYGDCDGFRAVGMLEGAVKVLLSGPRDESDDL